ncbi:MAG: metal-dependent hydrolase [Balneolaceae bacterium]
MDPLTHGLVGTAAALSVRKEENQGPVAITGFISAVIADLDYFIYSSSDPLLNIEIHRQFTHSLIFIPVGALVASAILWWFMKKHLTFRQLYLYSMVSYATAGLLDACTSYGTMLLWPFSDTRFAWNIISVVDPVFTTGIILFIGLSFYFKNRRFSHAAFIWLAVYLFFGLAQRERATHFAERLANARGHLPERMVVKPSIGNLILWRSTYEYEDRFYADGVRVGLTSWNAFYYQGESQSRFYPEKQLSEYTGTVLYNDIFRFSALSEGYLIRHPENPEIIGDARYSMLPNSLKPLWGVKLNKNNPDQHLDFQYFRDTSREVRDTYKKMILGHPVDAND